ncbi:MAG TPA: response regulator [Hyphomicrobiaceae bacterium]|nr:response regulator [Hyphomicrobiaceae bacterium]
MKRTALLVEDDPLLRWDLAQFVNSLGFEVIDCDSGPEAIAHLDRASEIDVLITDVDLGGLITGSDVAQAFDAVSPQLQIIITSGRERRPPCLDGKALFMPKPLRLDLLASVLSDGLAPAA